MLVNSYDNPDNYHIPLSKHFAFHTHSLSLINQNLPSKLYFELTFTLTRINSIPG